MAARNTTRRSAAQGASFRNAAVRLSEIGREFYGRGWALGTSGNYSALLSRNPLRMAITATGIDKSRLDPDDFLEVNGRGQAGNGSRAALNPPAANPCAANHSAEFRGAASAETLLHMAVARIRGAGAVLHTHSVWGTLLSTECAAQGGIAIEGYEMLKGLAGVRTHEHREWLPILQNQQDRASVAKAVAQALQRHPRTHGFLLEGHGLYTWGRDIEEARQHVEILEFLLEVVGRRLPAGSVDSVPSVHSVLSVGNSGRKKVMRRVRKSR